MDFADAIRWLRERVNNHTKSIFNQGGKMKVVLDKIITLEERIEKLEKERK